MKNPIKRIRKNAAKIVWLILAIIIILSLILPPVLSLVQVFAQ
jgi:hypothetical protein